MDAENEVLSLSLQEYAEMEDEWMRKMPEKWPMLVAAKIDDTPVLFKFFCTRKTMWEFVFHSRVKIIGQR